MSSPKNPSRLAKEHAPVHSPIKVFNDGSWECVPCDAEGSDTWTKDRHLRCYHHTVAFLKDLHDAPCGTIRRDSDGFFYCEDVQPSCAYRTYNSMRMRFHYKEHLQPSGTTDFDTELSVPDKEEVDHATPPPKHRHHTPTDGLTQESAHSHPTTAAITTSSKLSTVANLPSRPSELVIRQSQVPRLSNSSSCAGRIDRDRRDSHYSSLSPPPRSETCPSREVPSTDCRAVKAPSTPRIPSPISQQSNVTKDEDPSAIDNQDALLRGLLRQVGDLTRQVNSLEQSVMRPEQLEALLVDIRRRKTFHRPQLKAVMDKLERFAGDLERYMR